MRRDFLTICTWNILSMCVEGQPCQSSVNVDVGSDLQVYIPSCRFIFVTCIFFPFFSLKFLMLKEFDVVILFVIYFLS